MSRKWPVVGSVAAVGGALATLTGVGGLTLVDAVVLLGVFVVMPVCLPEAGERAWVLSGAALVVSFALDEGIAAVLFVTPWLVTAGFVTWRRAWAWWADRTSIDALGAAAAAAFALVAAGSLVPSRAGISVLGLHEPIIELTAVHYSFAGVGATTLALLVIAAHRARLALAGLAMTIVAPPIVAVGFVVEHPVPQVGGAVLMTAGVYCTAVCTLLAARARVGAARVLLVASAIAVVVPMVLAVFWAASNYWDVPALSVRMMARTHGLTNGLGFVIGGLAGWHLARAEEHTEVVV